MNYKEIQKALSTLKGYLEGIDLNCLSIQGTHIYNKLLNYLNHIVETSTFEKVDPTSEIKIFMVLNDYIFDLLEDYEDLDDFDKHVEEYQMLQEINSEIIAFLANDEYN